MKVPVVVARFVRFGLAVGLIKCDMYFLTTVTGQITIYKDVQTSEVLLLRRR
jgi:hypothetical protein